MIEGPPYDGTGPADRDIAERIVESFNIVGGHLSADAHTHIHRKLGELWSVSPGEVSVADGDVLDIVVENPADSGNIVEVLSWSLGANNDSKVTQYRDSGIYTGNANQVLTQNFDDTVTESSDFNAEFATGADPQLVDTGTDTQFNGGFYTGQTQANKTTATIAGRPELDLTIAEGRSFAIHLEALSAVDPIPGLVITEYEQERDLEPNP